MLTKSKLPLLIVLICASEAVIFLWAVWTTEAEFVFDKCARNSGRASSAIILSVLVMVGFYGLKRIYPDEKKRDSLRVLFTLFAANHLIHFFYVFQNFKSHTMTLSIAANLHGFTTFLFVLIMPFILWWVQKINTLLYFGIILHLFNVSYFICETFLSKVKPDQPAYHNQFGILVISAACIYVLYRVFRESRLKTQGDLRTNWQGDFHRQKSMNEL